MRNFDQVSKVVTLKYTLQDFLVINERVPAATKFTCVMTPLTI